MGLEMKFDNIWKSGSFQQITSNWMILYILKIIFAFLQFFYHLNLLNFA